MRATLIVDSIGHNPDYKPPTADQFATDEEFHDAQALYDVEPERIWPAGTELTGSHCWVHCFPEDSTGFEIDLRTRRRVPVRLGVGTVRAIPADAACEAALMKHVKHAAASRRVSAQVIVAEIAQGVAASRAQQDENNRLSAESAKTSASETATEPEAAVAQEVDAAVAAEET